MMYLPITIIQLVVSENLSVRLCAVTPGLDPVRGVLGLFRVLAALDHLVNIHNQFVMRKVMTHTTIFT